MSFNILLIIAATVVVFLILREVICWYFKINERVKLQSESNAQQILIVRMLKVNSEGAAAADGLTIGYDGVKRYN
jgi:hypothetical protein